MSSKTVLVVEDDPHLRTVYRTVISRRGYDVLTATQGAEGVHLARRHHPDLILLDLRIPVMDGWGAAEYLRADPATVGIPLIAVSGVKLATQERERASRFFDRIVPKGKDTAEVVSEIESRIGPPGSREPAPSDLLSRSLPLRLHRLN